MTRIHFLKITTYRDNAYLKFDEDGIHFNGLTRPIWGVSILRAIHLSLLRMAENEEGGDASTWRWI
jgi:hypothetical protein